MFPDDLIERNRAFVAGRRARPLPEAGTIPLAVVACYDPRLDELLPAALGLAPGEAFLLRTPGATVRPGSGILRALAIAVYLFDVDRVLIVGHTSCRMASFPTADFASAFRRRGVPRQAFGDDDLRTWAGAIPTPRQGVLTAAAAIADAPFLPPNLRVAGAILDDASGALELVVRPGDSPHRDGVAPGEAEDEGEPEGQPEVGPEVEPAAEHEPEVETAAAGAPPPPPPPASDPLSAPLRTLVERLASLSDHEELRKLYRALLVEQRPIRKLGLLQRLVREAAEESPEVIEAFAELRRQAAGAQSRALGEALDELLGEVLYGEEVE